MLGNKTQYSEFGHAENLLPAQTKSHSLETDTKANPVDNITVAHITAVDIMLSTLLIDQLKSLQADGYNVVGISTPGPYTSELTEAGIDHIPIRIARAINIPQDIVSLWNLYWIFRRNRFTIINTHAPKPSLLGQVAAKLAGVPVIINTVHGYHFHDLMPPMKRQFYLTLEKIASKCSDLILSQNQEDIEIALEEHMVSPDKMKYIGNGIDLELFDQTRVTPETIQQKRVELGLPEGVPVVGFVGRLAAKRKGFLDFLVAAQHISEQIPEVCFLIAGSADIGKPDSVDPASVNEYGIADRCFFVGLRPREEMPEFYPLMDVLALPSIMEGIPRAVLEAAAMGVPAVVTDVKGNREAVIHNLNGLLVPYGNPEMLADALLTILNDSDMAQRMGREGRKLVHERFDELRSIERVKAEYLHVLQQKGLID